jgi:hypothetical protein
MGSWCLCQRAIVWPKIGPWSTACPAWQHAVDSTHVRPRIRPCSSRRSGLPGCPLRGQRGAPSSSTRAVHAFGPRGPSRTERDRLWKRHRGDRLCRGPAHSCALGGVGQRSSAGRRFPRQRGVRDRLDKGSVDLAGPRRGSVGPAAPPGGLHLGGAPSSAARDMTSSTRRLQLPAITRFRRLGSIPGTFERNCETVRGRQGCNERRTVRRLHSGPLERRG